MCVNLDGVDGRSLYGNFRNENKFSSSPLYFFLFVQCHIFYKGTISSLRIQGRTSVLYSKMKVITIYVIKIPFEQTYDIYALLIFS